MVHYLKASIALVVCLMSISLIDAFFLQSLSGVATDIVKNPLESLSLVALKTYLLGNWNGRVQQYRQMMYNANRPYGPYQYNYGQQRQQQQQQQQPLQQPQQQQQQYQPQPQQPLNGQYYSNVHNRPRRSLVENDSIRVEDPVNQDDDISAEDFLEIADKLDVNKCIPRLVCEVMAGSDVTQGGQFKDLVTKAFGDDIPEVDGDKKMFKSIYHYAAFTGQQNGNTARCQQLFPKCKASDTEFRKMAEKIFYGVDHSADDADDRADNDGDH